MSDIKVNLDISSLTQYLNNFAKEIAKDVQKGIKGLAEATHANMVKEVGQKLNTQIAKKYLASLSQAVQISDFLWEITLNEPAVPIEEGKPWDMKGKPGEYGLLKDSETVKNGPNKGKHYKIIPMPQGKESDSLNIKTLAKNEELIGSIKGFLKGQKLSWSGIEKDSNGSPRISKMGPNGHPLPLHVFDIPSKIPGRGNTEQLARLHIYQVLNKNGNAKKVMTTFRTVIEGDDGKWQYPAQNAKGFFPDAAEWAQNEWNNSVLPAILQKYKG
jgi:hypothetical protein